MESIILTKKELTKMNRIYAGNNSDVYEEDNFVYKIFSDEFKFTTSFVFLEQKLKEADNLDVLGIVLPEAIIYDDYGRLSGIKYPKTGRKYERESLSLEDYTKRHIDIKNMLIKASDQNVILTDMMNFSNLRINDDKGISVIDFDGMQIKHFPAQGHSSIFFKYFMKNQSVVSKYYSDLVSWGTNDNLLNDQINKFNQIVLYFADVTGLDMSVFNIYGINSFIKSIGIEERSIEEKILNLYRDDPNMYFTDDEFELINDKYTLKENTKIPGAMRFEKK